MSIIGLIDTLRARQPLRDIENAQQTDVQVAAPGDTGDDQGSPMMPQTKSQFLGKNYDKPLDDAGLAQARTQARVATMRQNSLYGEADEAEKAGLSAAQSQAQTREITARAGGQELTNKINTQGFDRGNKAEEIDAEIGKSLGENPTPDALIDAHRKRIVEFQKAGLNEQVGAATKAYTDAVGTKVNLEAGERQRAGVQALSALQQNDFGPAIDFYKKYIPDGQHVESVTAGSKPGLLKVTVNAGGKSVTKEVQAADFMKTAQQTLATASSGSAKEALGFITKQALDGATTAAHLAQAKASTASAGYYGAHATYMNQKGVREEAIADKENTLEKARSDAADALSVPEEQRTPEQQQAVMKWKQLQTLERMRPGAGGAGAAAAGQARTMNAKVNGRDVTIRTGSDGTPGEYLEQASPTDRSMVWKPIKRGDTVQMQPGAAPAPGAPASSGGRPPLSAFKR